MNRFTSNIMSDLTDFSNVAISSRYSYFQKPSNNAQQHSGYELEQLDLNNHGKLLEQFKKLRQKLKQEGKRHIATKKQWERTQKRYQQKIERLEAKDKDNQSAMRYLKKEVEIINDGIDKLKKRNIELEKQSLVKNKWEVEIEGLERRVVELESQKQELRLEREKTEEILLMEKLELEAKLGQVSSVNKNDEIHNKQLESELIKSRQINIMLESKIKRIKDEYSLKQIEKIEQSKSTNIRFSEIQKQNDELRRQNDQLKLKYQQQKLKRKRQQNVQLKKYQVSSLHNLQHQAQEKQLNQLRRRVEKLTDRYELKTVQAECEIFKSMETLAKFWKTVDIAEELIHRLKKEGNFKEDIEKLIKVSEYKISKIKESENKTQKQSMRSSNQSSLVNLTSKKKSVSRSRSRSRSRSKSPSCYTAQKSKPQSHLATEFHSYTTPKLCQPVELFPDICLPKDTKTLDQKVKKQIRQKQSQLRTDLQFQKYNKINLTGQY